MTSEQDSNKTSTSARNNKSVFWQKPNPPLIGWAIFFGVSFMTGDNYLASSLRHISFALLLTWAIMEVISGANSGRRGLGLMVVLGVVANYFRPKKAASASN